MAFKIPSLEEMEKVHENMDTTPVTVLGGDMNAVPMPDRLLKTKKSGDGV